LNVLEDSEMRARLITGGRKMAAQCSWDAVKMSWAQVYRDLVESDEQS
jgi:hypothetical protein